MECVKTNRKIGEDELEILIDRGYEEASTMKTIDIFRTQAGQELNEIYTNLYNSLMDAAEEKGLDTKLIVKTISSCITMDNYYRGVREKLIRNYVI